MLSWVYLFKLVIMFYYTANVNDVTTSNANHLLKNILKSHLDNGYQAYM